MLVTALRQLQGMTLRRSPRVSLPSQVLREEFKCSEFSSRTFPNLPFFCQARSEAMQYLVIMGSVVGGRPLVGSYSGGGSIQFGTFSANLFYQFCVMSF